MTIPNISKNIKFFKYVFKKYHYRLIARIASAGFILAIIIPNIFINFASAYGQVTSRFIELSTSAVSATSVSYDVGFTTATAGAIEGVVVDFCSNDPIIGDTCTPPTGFTVTAAPTTNATYTGLNPTTSSSWTIADANTGRTFLLTDTTATTSIAASTAISFTITSVTNPSVTGSFYARILTYTTAAGATGYTATAVGSPTDAGGVALSTVTQITITSKVQEEITFCVYTSAADGGNCSGTGSTVTLGNTNGVLSTSGPFVDISTKYDIQTNALHGAVIRFEGTVPTSGANVIESSTLSGSGSVAATAYSSTSGSPQFGLCSWSSGGTTANLTPASPYNNASCNTTTQTAGTGTTGGAGSAQFAFNIANAASTYGDTLANAVAGNYAIGQIAFLGNISTTNIAGIYTTTITFIATGTYQLTKTLNIPEQNFLL